MNKQNLNKIIGFSLAASIAFSPMAAFAKNDHSNEGRGETDVKTSVRVEDREDHHASSPSHCKAFGHLIAFGWMKKHGTTTVDANCVLPFGIALKLHGDRPHATSTATTTDTSAPSLFFVNARTGTSTATITWYTNERADSQLVYGTSTSYGSTTTRVDDRTFFHSVTLTGLNAGTTYHFAVKSRDAAGNLVTSDDKTFTTKALTDTVAPILSLLGVSGVSSTSATVSWTTDEPATSKIFYASGSSLNLATASTLTNAALTTNHSLSVSGLSASTTYSFAVQSSDAAGNTSTSAVGSFLTNL